MKSSSLAIRGFVFTLMRARFAHTCAILFAIASFMSIQCYAQEKTTASRLLEMKSGQDSITRQNPAEKIYLQLDKSAYTPGDTLWFKAYLFNAPTLGLSAKSALMYLSIVTDSNVVVKRQRLPVENGLSWGNISLKDLPAGTYTLVAYTQWLQNFKPDCFFRKQFTIADDAGSNWLANYTSSSIMTDGKEQAHVKLLLSDVYKTAVAGKPVQLMVMKGRRRLYRQTIQTDEKGLIDITFNLPGKPGDIRIIASDARGNRVNIPLNFNRPQDADVQFMPEGGDLMADLPAHIGFKAIGLDGKGINVSGVVLDREKQVVANFTTQHLGMGSFNLPVVNKGESYTAKVTLPGGAIREFPLPDVKNEGIVLNVINSASEDSVKILIAATDKIARLGESYFLIGKAREVICYGAMVDFKNSTSISQKISKRLFPSGITHFILLDMKNRPLNERLIFINRHDDLHLNISTDKIAYSPHDSIALRISINDALGNPVAGNFSLAVTDDALVHPDSLNNENIITRILLTSELKGYVEEPNYYLNTNDAASKEALDNLLLTQGWISYSWPDEKGRPVYAAETEVAIKGRVLNVFNNPVKKTKVQLFSKSPVVATDTLTDKNGEFMFRKLPLADTPAYFIKTAKNFNVSITMDDAPPPVLLASAGAKMPWYVSNDTTLLNSLKNNRTRQNLADGLPIDTKALKEVKITAKKIVKGSQNINGAGNADWVFDEDDMLKAGKKSLLEFLEEHVSNLRSGTLTNKYNLRYALQDKSLDEVSAIMQIVRQPPLPTVPWYLIDNKPMVLIVDGIAFGSVIKVMSLNEPNGNDIKSYLESNTAEDVKGIEINSSGKYGWEYFRRYILADWKHYLNSTDIAFVEITTRDGKGPGIAHTPGAYLYKPLALSIPAHFYRPRYPVKDKVKHADDLRSTIHWEPNINAGADGKALVSFYATGKPSTYTFIMEGTDGNGSIGFKTGKIKISNSVSP